MGNCQASISILDIHLMLSTFALLLLFAGFLWHDREATVSLLYEVLLLVNFLYDFLKYVVNACIILRTSLIKKFNFIPTWELLELWQGYFLFVEEITLISSEG